MPRTFHSNRRFAYVLALVLPLMLLAGAANARADISFRADYENGSCCVSGGWHDVQYEFDRPMTDSFSIVTSPVRQGRYAAKVVAQQGYSPFGWNESTEAASGMSDQGEGTDYYYAWSTMFDSSWVSPYGWGDIVQFYTDNWEKFGGPPPIALDTSGSHIDVAVLTGRYDEPGTSADAWRGWYTHPGTSTSVSIGYSFKENYTVLNTLSAGHWNDFVMHVHWSAHAGQIQMWHRLPGESWIEVLDVNVPTLRYDPQTNVSDDIGLMKQGIYRQSYCQQPTVLTACNSLLGLQPPDVLYQDAFVRGSSFDEVVAAAFDGSSSPPPSAPAASTPPQTSASSPPAPTGPDLPLVTGLAVSADSGCAGCTVSTTRGSGDVDATIGGGLDSVDTAYGLADFGGATGWSGRVWTRDVLALAPSTTLGGNLSVLQQRDTNGQLVWEIYVDGSNRQLSLWSPAGGLGSSAINQSTGIAMDGQSHRVEVSALPNDSVVVRVDGQDRITLAGLSGSTSGNLRFLRVGIDHYDTGTTSEPIAFGHSDVGVSTVGWLGSRTTALASAPAGGGGQQAAGTGGTAAAPSGGGGGGGGGGAAFGAPRTTGAGSGNSITKNTASAGGNQAPASKTTVTTKANASGNVLTRQASRNAVATATATRRPLAFSARPQVTGRRTVLIRLRGAPHSRLQIIVRDADGRTLGSTYAVSSSRGRSLQVVMLHRWRGQATLKVIARSHNGGRVQQTTRHIRMTHRELAVCHGSH